MTHRVWFRQQSLKGFIPLIAGIAMFAAPGSASAVAPAVAVGAVEGGTVVALAGLATYGICEMQSGDCYNEVIKPTAESISYYTSYAVSAAKSGVAGLLLYGGAPPDPRAKADWDWFHSPESWQPTMRRLGEALVGGTMGNEVAEESPTVDYGLLQQQLGQQGEEIGGHGINTVVSSQEPQVVLQQSAVEEPATISQ